MLFDVLALAAPLAILGAGAVLAAWDAKRWKARTTAAARPVPVRLFPHGAPPLYPPRDTSWGRYARKARHGETNR